MGRCGEGPQNGGGGHLGGGPGLRYGDIEVILGWKWGEMGQNLGYGGSKWGEMGEGTPKWGGVAHRDIRRDPKMGGVHLGGGPGFRYGDIEVILG